MSMGASVAEGRASSTGMALVEIFSLLASRSTASAVVAIALFPKKRSPLKRRGFFVAACFCLVSVLAAFLSAFVRFVRFGRFVRGLHDFNKEMKRAHALRDH